jgi:hypothetical protein
MRYGVNVYMKEEIDALVEAEGISEKYAKSLIESAIYAHYMEIIEYAKNRIAYHKENGEYEERNKGKKAGFPAA